MSYAEGLVLLLFFIPPHRFFFFFVVFGKCWDKGKASGRIQSASLSSIYGKRNKAISIYIISDGN